MPQLEIASYDHALQRGAPAKIIILTNEVDTLIAAAHALLPPGLFHIIRGSPDPFFVEFLSPASSKGSALMHICKRLGVPLAETVCFGDGDNDQEMLVVAGLGLAMQNANAVAKVHIPFLCLLNPHPYHNPHPYNNTTGEVA